MISEHSSSTALLCLQCFTTRCSQAASASHCFLPATTNMCVEYLGMHVMDDRCGVVVGVEVCVVVGLVVMEVVGDVT